MERREIPDQITSYFVGLRVHGIAMILDWEENIGFIEMEPFEIHWSLDKVQHVTDSEFKECLEGLINDNGFGCRKLLGAHCYIEGQYTNGTRIYIDDLYVSKNKKLTEKDCEKFEQFENKHAF